MPTSCADLDSTIGTTIATAIPAGHRRRNQSRPQAASPITASTANARCADPEIQPSPGVPALVIASTRPPAAHAATQARSAASSVRVRGP